MMRLVVLLTLLLAGCIDSAPSNTQPSDMGRGDVGGKDLGKSDLDLPDSDAPDLAPDMPIATLPISPDADVFVGQNVQFQVVGVEPKWSTTTNDIVSIGEASGIATFLSPGTAKISVALANGRSGSINIDAEFRLKSITAGYLHSCGVAPNGVGFCWGAGDSGQLGNGRFETSAKPVRVGGNHRFIKIEAGETHTCGLTVAKSVHCWGQGANGRLGDTSETKRNTPGVAILDGVSNISLGNAHGCAITNNNKLLCWGADADHQCGDGDPADNLEPQSSVTELDWSRVSTGAFHTCGFDLNVARCWGSNSHYQLGSSMLAQVVSLNAYGFSQFAAGRRGTCGLTQNEKALCWGIHQPYGSTDRDSTPAGVSDIAFTRLVAGGTHFCGFTSNSAVHCWGNSQAGWRGVSGDTIGDTPLKLGVFEKVSLGSLSTDDGIDSHACAIDRNDIPYCWGDNGQGQLGVVSSDASESRPVLVWAPSEGP